jgi:hypothetical protein
MASELDAAAIMYPPNAPERHRPMIEDQMPREQAAKTLGGRAPLRDFILKTWAWVRDQKDRFEASRVS